MHTHSLICAHSQTHTHTQSHTHTHMHTQAHIHPRVCTHMLTHARHLRGARGHPLVLADPALLLCPEERGREGVEGSIRDAPILAAWAFKHYIPHTGPCLSASPSPAVRPTVTHSHHHPAPSPLHPGAPGTCWLFRFISTVMVPRPSPSQRRPAA